jgi:hypothetical protein
VRERSEDGAEIGSGRLEVLRVRLRAKPNQYDKHSQ